MVAGGLQGGAEFIRPDLEAAERTDLTGIWKADDEGTYYLRQVGNTVYWLGMSHDNGGSFTNVFRGTIIATPSGGIGLAGEWADLPLGRGVEGGTLRLRGPRIAIGPVQTAGPVLTKEGQTGAFKAATWVGNPNFRWGLFNRKLDPTFGRRKAVLILWDPRRPDHPAPARADIQRLVFGARPSVTDWFQENSGGKLILEPAGILGWHTADKPAEHYWDNTNTDDARIDNDSSDYHNRRYGDGWLSGHVEKYAEAIRKADPDFNFAAYDINYDGKLQPSELAILMVIPQRDPDGFVRDVVGLEVPSRELVVDGVAVQTISEWYTGLPLNLGTPAHELSHHAWNAPDMYFTKPWRFAAGAYSIMDHSFRTVHIDPFCRLKLGWLKYAVVDESGEYALHDVETRREVLILYDRRRGPREYYLIENRWRGRSYDAGTPSSGAGVPADGIAVWHILEDPKMYGPIPAPNSGPGDWGRRGVRLIRANGGVPTSDELALFGNGAVLTDDSSPTNLRWLDGSASGLRIQVLTNPGPEVRIRVDVPR
jgi:M6 family metalloprotease-like protein